VRVSGDSAPSQPPTPGLAPLLATGQAAKGLRSVLRPRIDTMPLRAALELRCPALRPHPPVPPGRRGTACSSPPKPRLSLAAFPGSGGLCCVCVCTVPRDKSFVGRRKDGSTRSRKKGWGVTLKISSPCLLLLTLGNAACTLLRHRDDESLLEMLKRKTETETPPQEKSS